MQLLLVLNTRSQNAPGFKKPIDQDMLTDLNLFCPQNSHLVNLEFVKKCIRQEDGNFELTYGSHFPISWVKLNLSLQQMDQLRR